MANIELTDISAAAARHHISRFRRLVQRYHDEPGFRRQLEADPLATFRDAGINLPSNIEVRVATNTHHKHYVVLPPDPNTELGDEMLDTMAGGDSAGTAGTLGSIGSAGGSLGSALCLGSASTAG